MTIITRGMGGTSTVTRGWGEGYQILGLAPELLLTALLMVQLTLNKNLIVPMEMGCE
jgi:hypothetical protein